MQRSVHSRWSASLHLFLCGAEQIELLLPCRLLQPHTIRQHEKWHGIKANCNLAKLIMSRAADPAATRSKSDRTQNKEESLE